MAECRVEIDPTAGFCFGVEKAITMAEELLKGGAEVYGLGHMVHNEEEIGRLADLGLKTINLEELGGLRNAQVVLRAHGEPPSTYELARKNKIKLVDATCPIVIKLQDRIARKYKEINPAEEQIVIFGKAGHPESIGLIGQTNGTAVLVTDPDDLSAIDPGKKVILFSQTTMDPDRFHLLEENLGKYVKGVEKESLVSHCTICGQMKKRKPGLKQFALSHDVMVFVSGSKSSNGAMLYRYCKSLNPKTYWVHSAEAVDPEWLKDTSSVGISGATSTPAWQLEQVRDKILLLIKD